MLPRGLISRKPSIDHLGNSPEKGPFATQTLFPSRRHTHTNIEKKEMILDFVVHDNGRPVCGDFHITGYDTSYYQGP